MATVKIKFRPSLKEAKEGAIYYQVIHGRVARQINTSYKLFSFEWDVQCSRILLSEAREGRRLYLKQTNERMVEDVRRLEGIIAVLERKGSIFTADDVASLYYSKHCSLLFSVFMQEVIEKLQGLGKVRTGETYRSALSSFMHFMEGKDILLEDMDSDLMMSYEAWLKEREVAQNSISFYMRILRATYNRAVEKGLTAQQFPFRHVYTGIEKTMKRAVSLHVIRQLMVLDLSRHPARGYARDMLLFSFYTRGMSMIDMAFLKKKDLSNGILTYRRKKTGQQLLIKWEPCMQEIVNRHNNPDSPYLLSIISRPGKDERRQYVNESHRINRYLKILGKELGLYIPLTHYVGRHSWASAARSKNIPISVISEGMGHDSEATTRIYLASLDTSTVDKANRLILRSLHSL